LTKQTVAPGGTALDASLLPDLELLERQAQILQVIESSYII
jgi:hypothetical protein